MLSSADGASGRKVDHTQAGREEVIDKHNEVCVIDTSVGYAHLQDRPWLEDPHCVRRIQSNARGPRRYVSYDALCVGGQDMRRG
jgi:hypothetical protein